ncbi:ThuA domain-containing protein [Singulisphaera sp. PoT]|uniref:ThuA domain-containing protein n=1 Tax=Singulisphaera sp. PoT TaxID=3411797 RepID=UPI003BF55AD6
MNRTFGLLGLIAVVGASTPAQAAEGTVKVLVLSGQGEHDWRETTPLVRRILGETGRFDVRVCEVPSGLSAQSLAGIDVVVDDSGVTTAGGEAEKAIASFVESGKGLVLTQSALLSKPKSGSTHGLLPVSGASPTLTPTHFFTVKLGKDEHPIVRGLRPEIQVADAFCRGLSLSPKAKALAYAVDSATTAGGEGEPVLIASELGKGRVFATALGKGAAGMHESAFKTVLARGTEWAATGNVTLPVDNPAPPKSPDAIRGMVINGGHDHETAFYSLFDGYKDLNWLPVIASATAFQKDLRGKYDVLIMYDFTRDLDDNGKKNLRDFVESGGGVVVLHHALLNYQKWTWWYQDVVGGSYRLAREGTTPSSSVKDGEHMFVTPKDETHPILAGIAPFHIVDESYGRMYISPKVRPLLTTENPNSTPVVAWIGPDPKFKVVAIQLGHGHTAFANPTYRRLVHNAILWASGKSQ